MSKYLCGVCNRFYETKGQMKSCKHGNEKVIIKEEIVVLSEDEQMFNELIIDIDDLLADDMEFVADFLDVDYTTLNETRQAVKEFLGLN